MSLEEQAKKEKESELIAAAREAVEFKPFYKRRRFLLLLLLLGAISGGVLAVAVPLWIAPTLVMSGMSILSILFGAAGVSGGWIIVGLIGALVGLAVVAAVYGAARGIHRAVKARQQSDSGKELAGENKAKGNSEDNKSSNTPDLGARSRSPSSIRRSTSSDSTFVEAGTPAGIAHANAHANDADADETNVNASPIAKPGLQQDILSVESRAVVRRPNPAKIKGPSTTTSTSAKNLATREVLERMQSYIAEDTPEARTAEHALREQILQRDCSSLTREEQRALYLAAVGMGPDSSDEAVKKAMKSLFLRWHPDKTHGDDAGFVLLMEMYKQIKNPSAQGYNQMENDYMSAADKDMDEYIKNAREYMRNAREYMRNTDDYIRKSDDYIRRVDDYIRRVDELSNSVAQVKAQTVESVERAKQSVQAISDKMDGLEAKAKAEAAALAKEKSNASSSKRAGRSARGASAKRHTLEEAESL